jgi:hypothetical protein
MTGQVLAFGGVHVTHPVICVPAHTPAVHLSFSVQGFRSSHCVLSALLRMPQVPFAWQKPSWHWVGLPTVAHWVLLVQRTQPTTVVPPVQTPAWHFSPVVHALRSQAVLSALFSMTQKP